jgi:threonine/homoserine/homoserine lactone efflux protein
MITDFAAFLGISVLVIVTPGQDTALTIRNALRGRRKAGVFTALGISSGQGVWTVATSAGLAALLIASEPAFVALKLAGAAYLILLGAQMLLAALRSGGTSAQATGGGSPRPLTPAVAFRQGLISNLGNPKMAVFFTSLLPQFNPRGDASFLALLLLGLVFSCLTLAWLTGYAFAVARAGDFLRRPKIRRALDGLFGTVLVAFGLRLATAHR